MAIPVPEYTFGDPQQKATKVSQFRAALTAQGGEVYKLPLRADWPEK